MSKSLLKSIVADRISELNTEISFLKEYVGKLYSSCDKSNPVTEPYFLLLNLRRNEFRRVKRKLRNLEKLQKRIKELPDELLDTSRKYSSHKSQGNMIINYFK